MALTFTILLEYDLKGHVMSMHTCSAGHVWFVNSRSTVSRRSMVAVVFYASYVHVHENSVGLSSTTTPIPKGKPSHCLLRQT